MNASLMNALFWLCVQILHLSTDVRLFTEQENMRSDEVELTQHLGT